MRRYTIAVILIYLAILQQSGSSRIPFFTQNATAQEGAKVFETTTPTIREELPTVVEARRQAKILHTAMHSTLQIVHHRYYQEDQSMPLPAATLNDVFAELEREEGIKLRWLAVDGQAMNIAHEPKSTFEFQAAEALKSGKGEFELIDNGVYRRVGTIQLSNVCLKCHVPDRKSLENRTAGLIIGIPVRK